MRLLSSGSRELGCAGKGADRVTILAGVAAELLGTELAGAPALIERVLEHVDRGASLVEHG